MKKKQNSKERNHYYIQWGIITIILLFYIVGTLVSYNTDMMSSARSKAVDRVNKQALQLKGYYEGKHEALVAAAKGIADYCSEQEDICGASSLDCINSFAEAAAFSNVYIVLPDGSAIDKNGNEYAQLDSTTEYKAMISGEDTTYIRRNELGEIAVMEAVPISDGTSHLGSLVVEFVPKEIENQVDIPIYSYMLVSRKGLVLETLGDYGICKVGDNLTDIVKNLRFRESNATAFINALSSGRSVNLVVEANKLGEYYIITQPIANTEYEIAIVVKAKQIERNAAEDNLYTENLVKKLIVALGVFIVLLAVVYGINRIAVGKTSRELQNKAETDLLTGLLNKISTENRIKEYLEGEGKNKTCMMCVLDIDNFKKINDTMGHAFGDEVLASLGRQISAEFRVSDVIGRMGGDEFIIFLKDLKDETIISKEASRVANFFKNFTVGEYTKYAATASIGAAMYPKDATDFESLYKAADTALYKSKNRGKNQMSFYKEDDK